MFHRGSFAALASLAIVGMCLCACGKGKPDDASGTAAATVDAVPVDPAMLKTVEEHLEPCYKGTDKTPPETSPKPTPGKNVWILSPGQGGDSSSVHVNAAKEAGEAIGWKMTIFDGQGDASRYPLGVRQAVAAKADAIIDAGVDCAWIRQALVEAHAAKVKVVAYNALDCDDPAIKGEPLFDATNALKADVAGQIVTDYRTLLKVYGLVKADWIIDQTHGRAKVIEFKEDEFLVLKYIREGFEAELATCKTCELVKTVDFTLADYGPGLPQKTQGALLQHPEANSIVAPYDTAMLAISPAIRESGRVATLHVMGGEGAPTNITLIRDHAGQDAAGAFAAPWAGYAAIDTLNRVFHGEPSQPSGAGMMLIDREHNMPPVGHGYETKVDFKAAYLKAWGITK